MSSDVHVTGVAAQCFPCRFAAVEPRPMHLRAGQGCRVTCGGLRCVPELLSSEPIAWQVWLRSSSRVMREIVADVIL